MLLVTVIGCLGFATNVNAEEYGTEFQKFTSDGTITITSGSLEAKGNLVTAYLQQWNQKNNTQFVLGSCNEAYDTCTIALNDANGNYEEHDIQIKYAEKYSDVFKKIGTDAITITNTTNGSVSNIIYLHLNNFSNDQYSYWLGTCNEDSTQCDIILRETYKMENGSTNSVEIERHTVKVNYKEEYSEQFKKITSNGTLTLYGDTYRTPIDMIRDYLAPFNVYATPSYDSYSVFNCNADSTVCDIVRSTVDTTNYNQKELERHVVKVTYQKGYSEEFKKATNGSLIIKSNSIDQYTNFVNIYFNPFNAHDYDASSYKSYNIRSCNEDKSICDVALYEHTKQENGNYTVKQLETHAIKITYKEEYSEEFKKLTNGTITLHGSTIGEKRNLLSNYLNSITSDSYYFSVRSCNEDQTVCDIALHQSVQTGDSSTTYEVERHPVKIVYGEEQFSDVFKRLTTNNQLPIKSVTPTDIETADLIVGSYLRAFDTENGYFYVGACSDDYTTCDVYSTETGETHALKIAYETNLDPNISAIVNNMIAAYPDGKMFLLEDLELINYLVSKNFKDNDFGNENLMINFSSEAKAYLGNMTGVLDARMGWGDPFTSGCAGGFAIMYNNTIYGMLKQGGAQKNNVIYISDTTENKNEAYIVAAQKRINAYLKNDSVKITYGGKVSDLIDISNKDEVEFISEELGYDITKIESYYNLTYGENTIPFLIIKNSSKVKEEVEYKNNDFVTGISIETTSPDVPLDTTIQVTEITKENEQYQEITSKLKVKDAIIYDLKLFSSTAKQFISKLKDGLFQVKIPIPETMLNKELVAYYIHDDGTIEEHPITVMDGLAHFTTNHFSVYTIAEKRVAEDAITENVPNTYDGIMNYIGLGIVGLIGISITGITYKKKENES